jgi:hypothetical protein
MLAGVNPSEVGGALQVVGTVGVLGLFLPGIDRAWSSGPSSDEARRLRFGEGLYLGAALVLTLAASYANGSSAPLVLGFGLAVAVVAAHEYALRQAPRDSSTAGA